MTTAHFSSRARTQRSRSAASRGSLYFAWGCFRDFLSRPCRAPPKGRALRLASLIDTPRLYFPLSHSIGGQPGAIGRHRVQHSLLNAIRHEQPGTPDGELAIGASAGPALV